jgi:hypothetical protein
VADGFLGRQTRLGEDRLSLWPIDAAHGPEYVRAIVYRPSAPAGSAAAQGPDQPLQRLAVRPGGGGALTRAAARRGGEGGAPRGGAATPAYPS